MKKSMLSLALVIFALAHTAYGQTRSRAELQADTLKRPSAPRPLAIDTFRKISMSDEGRIKLAPKHRVIKPRKTTFRKGLHRNRVIVKFVDGAAVKQISRQNRDLAAIERTSDESGLDLLEVRPDELSTYDRHLLQRKNLTSARLPRQMDEFKALVRRHKARRLGKLFEGIDDKRLALFRLNAEIKKKRQSSDLANYFWINLEQDQEGERLVDALNTLDIVESAYLAPIPADPDVPPETDSFQDKQTYLNRAPTGIDAKYAWTIPGGKGKLVKIIDIEQGWNLNHEDLPSMFISDGRIATDDSSRQHGTAVMGVMLGLDDGSGVTGIVPEASGGVVSVKRGLGLAYNDNVAEAVLIAAMNLSPGDVILIEQHARGPGNDGDCTSCITSDGKPRDDCGFIAMEYWDDIFDAINAATAAGIIVVEAAGNGEMNLDNSRYNDKFDRLVRNSGALFVGGADSTSRGAKCWSNYGSRLDLQGWGENVMTTGYGSSSTFKINGADDNQWYTNSFSGTSSATPVVAGAVAAVQGVQIENNNPVLDWSEMRSLLVDTGTPQSGTKKIGPLPDLRAAIDTLVSTSPASPENAVFTNTITMDSASVTTDKVSGFSGSDSHTVGNSTSLLAIERLKFGERGDKGCYVRVEKADIVANKISSPHSELDLCGKKGPTERSLQYVPLLTTSHDTFIRGVSVCNSKTGNSTRLKGVKLYRTRVEADGSFTEISNPTTWDRANCDDNWRVPAMCPQGSLATQLIVHARNDKDDRVFTGLALNCRGVNVTRTCVSGC